MIDGDSREVLRTLAKKWMEYAGLPVMAERRRQWRCIKDLQMEQPMILVETCMLSDYIGEKELQCTDPYLRNIEKSLFEIVRHAEEIGDDIVVEPYFRIPWVLEISSYGLPIEAYHATSTDGSALGYSFHFSVQNEADVEKLHLRSRRVDREKTLHYKQLLDDIFGDILPVVVGGFDYFNRDHGYHPWLGNLYCGLTMDLFKLVGNDNLLLWLYDKPDLIHRIMALLRDDRIAHLRFMEQEKLLYVNTDTWNPCPGSYGYVSDLPDKANEIKLSDCWAWIDSQESEPISPAMMNEFFLPYMAEVTKLFGLTYYGCCEGVHDRLQHVIKAMPNLRAVSVSGWSDLFKCAEVIGRDYVYSRKPTPSYISGPYPDWHLVKKDAADTIRAARNCNLEFCFRDVYTVDGDRKRFSDWVSMVKSLLSR